MEAVRILEGRNPVTRTYDAEPDVLYLSEGALRPALGIDIGDGIVLRYDEIEHELGGLTIVGLQAKLQRELADHAEESR
jgi:hypothetical protein